MTVENSSAPLASVEQARAALGLTYAEIAAALGADESTLHRWRAGAKRPSPVFRQRLAAFEHLLWALWSAFGSEARGWSAARSWLEAPHPHCAGHPPRALLVGGQPELLVGLILARRGEPTVART